MESDNFSRWWCCNSCRVFAVYAHDNIQSANGSIIPANDPICPVCNTICRSIKLLINLTEEEAEANLKFFNFVRGTCEK